MNLFDIQNKVAVITGGSGAIGGCIAEGLAQAGCKLVILNRSEASITEKVKTLQAQGAEVLGIPCDVLQADSLRAARETILAQFGQIDFLINAAGGNVKGATQQPDQAVFELELPDIDQAIALNLHGALYPSLVFGEAMARRGSGSIINVSSMAAYGTISRVLGYSLAKTGINTLTTWLATELARKYGDQLRVNAIAPGFFIGEQNRALLTNPDGTFTDRGNTIIRQTPMGRFGEVNELVGAVQFLCSPAASFITGVVLPIDGGFSVDSGV